METSFLSAIRQKRLLILEQPKTKTIPYLGRARATMSTRQASNSLSLWHARMGHLNAKDIRSLGVCPRLVDDLPQLCKSCLYGKQQRTPSHIPMPRRKKRLQLIHSDVEEISPIAYGGYWYFVAFIDDCTRMEFGYLMKQKNEVCQHIVEKETGRRINRLRADNGLGEYTYTDFTSYRKNHYSLSLLHKCHACRWGLVLGQSQRQEGGQSHTQSHQPGRRVSASGLSGARQLGGDIHSGSSTFGINSIGQR